MTERQTVIGQTCVFNTHFLEKEHSEPHTSRKIADCIWCFQAKFELLRKNQNFGKPALGTVSLRAS